MRRAEEAGYRSGWRGDLAYLFSPELWSVPAFTLLVLGAGAFVGLVMLDDNPEAPVLFITLSLKALSGFFFVIRPLIRVAGRRERIAATSGAT